MPRRGKPVETESRLAFARGWEQGGGSEQLLVGMGFILGGDNIIEVVVMFVQLCECTKTH